jgi:hypothetical protein
MRRRSVITVMAVFCLAVLTAGADDFWVKKDWKTWTKGDCKKMLEESPWAKRSLVENNASNGSLPSAGQGSQSTAQLGNEGTGEITYYVQLRSAAPVRQAVIRQAQLDGKYDKMSDAEKKAFDDKMEKEMNLIKPEVIAVHVVFEANRVPLGDAVTKFWHSLPADSVPMNFYLVTEKGTKVPPMTFSFAKDTETEFDVTFPRNIGADPTIAPDAKSMKIQFPNPAVGDFAAKTVTSEYKFDKMSWNGKVTF